MTPEDAKALVAGPLGKEMGKFPLRFCKPAYFGVPPAKDDHRVVSNGTVSLINVREHFLAVTCSHVLTGYRRSLADDRRSVFAIGNCYLDPLAQLIAEDTAIDVAVFELTRQQVELITQDKSGIGEAFFETHNRPARVITNDFVAFGGFPGDLRLHLSFNTLNFGSYSSGACLVTDCHSDYFTCEFEREHWMINLFEHEPESLGGLSGGPAFVIRHSPSGIISYEYAGLIYRMHESTESLYIRQAQALPLPWG